MLPVIHLCFVFFSHIAVPFRLRWVELSEIPANWLLLEITPVYEWMRRTLYNSLVYQNAGARYQSQQHLCRQSYFRRKTKIAAHSQECTIVRSVESVRKIISTRTPAQLTQQATSRAMFEGNLLTKLVHLDRCDSKAHRAKEEQATSNCTCFRPRY